MVGTLELPSREPENLWQKGSRMLTAHKEALLHENPTLSPRELSRIAWEGFDLHGMFDDLPSLHTGAKDGAKRISAEDTGVSYDFSKPDIDGMLTKEDFEKAKEKMPAALTSLLAQHHGNQARDETTA